MDEFARLELLIGKEKINQLHNATVLVIGLGGVGSYAVESLVRSGIGHLILIDYDVIDITNLNRQLMTNHDNIGKLKVDVWEERIHKINPNCIVTKVARKILPEDIDSLFTEYSFSYLIDACDTIGTKCALIKKSLETKTTIISSMGTGNKMDPTKLEIIDIRKTSYDPIAKILRKKLKEMHVNQKVMVVCSTEVPKKIEGNCVASNAFVPATAGLYCTNYIVKEIVGDKDEKTNGSH